MSQAPPVMAFGDPMRLRKAMRVAACHGVALHHHADAATVVQTARQLRPEIVLFEYSFTDQGLKLASAIAEACPGSRIILLTEPSPPPDMAELIGQRWFGHMLGLESAWFMAELGATIAKLFGYDPFGIWCHLPWGARVLEAPISTSEDKQQIFAQIEGFLGSLGIRGRLVQRVQEVADEMLMNAVYDAPVDRATGKHLYAESPRTQRIELTEDQRPTFRMGSDGRVFAVSISDPFGGLSSEQFRRYIGKGLRGGADQIDDKAGGAGLGLYFLFERLNSLVLNVAPGRLTEMVGLIDIRGSFRAAVSAPKSLNIFVRPG